ncbi:MAG: hypothetical protein HN846_02310 [Candidatus Pacebacteria bacterium]|jgi:hypothetical protein|nr:hypothetical protein [Candidatus Paceibacterota bacterium]MBT3511842.1 hypothetical protein [Candidatus Paceibacterota bacterium]MBT4004589.1 hypothetical protein [Candidatus Paceibacterota bacterium]MBT4359299.1 hypothetical protein [Candidatus Paceibacterota bacterium]MBT6899031.1 hypothetical protein [Candidatus Paceibacterota bacterium]
MSYDADTYQEVEEEKVDTEITRIGHIYSEPPALDIKSLVDAIYSLTEEKAEGLKLKWKIVLLPDDLVTPLTVMIEATTTSGERYHAMVAGEYLLKSGESFSDKTTLEKNGKEIGCFSNKTRSWLTPEQYKESKPHTPNDQMMENSKFLDDFGSNGLQADLRIVHTTFTLSRDGSNLEVVEGQRIIILDFIPDSSLYDPSKAIKRSRSGLKSLAILFEKISHDEEWKKASLMIGITNPIMAAVASRLGFNVLGLQAENSREELRKKVPQHISNWMVYVNPEKAESLVAKIFISKSV